MLEKLGTKIAQCRVMQFERKFCAI
jgi:hypothetical protein